MQELIIQIDSANSNIIDITCYLMCLFFYKSNQIGSFIKLQMNLEERLQLVFPNQFQVNRVVKEIENVKDAKPKMGLEVRYISRQNVQFVMIVEIVRQKLKQIKKLSFLSKIEFKVVLKNSYPTEPPSIYFLNQNAIELGINPFHNYLKLVLPEWGPKVSVLDIIKLVPVFVIQCIQKTREFVGQPVLREYFEAQRLFTFQGCQVFPVKLLRSNVTFNGMIGIINGSEVVLLEQSNHSNSYIITDFIKMEEVYSVQKHKSKHLRALLQIKRNGKKFGIQFASDQYETIIGSIVEQMKALAIFDKEKIEDSEESDSDEPAVAVEVEQNQQIVINDHNINDVESQILILQSLVDSKPNSGNIKELVDLLKKAVEYYSIKADERCHIHLKTLQNIMNNQFMQVLLASEDTNIQKHEKSSYQSIANYV